jgi:hypothetical protein
MDEPRYKADLGGGSLKVPESRIIAALLLDGVSDERWRQVIEVENVLQRRSRGTAQRQASLLRARLRTMGPALWCLVRDGSGPTATQAAFAAAVKHSVLLGDFLDLTVREQFRMFRTELPRSLWAGYLEECRNRDPLMPVWQESTAAKQGDSVYRILAEVGFITDSKTCRLAPVRMAPEVTAYLTDNDEQYVLRCIRMTP